MADVLIIGSGPAGISAALYTVRAGLNTLVIGQGNSALRKAENIQNYYGFAQPISGKQLMSSGISQAQQLGATMVNDEVVGMGYDGDYVVKTKEGEYRAGVVILATGSPRRKPAIARLEEFEGKGVAYCAACDAFFYRGKDVAVLGCCEYARNEALELLPVAGSVTLLTNGDQPIKDLPADLRVSTSKVATLLGDDRLSGVTFADGSSIDVHGLFVAVGVAGSSDLARKLGAEVNGTQIVIDANMATNLPGLFAAGDCTGGMLQIAKAVYEGSKAGTEAVKYHRSVMRPQK